MSVDEMIRELEQIGFSEITEEAHGDIMIWAMKLGHRMRRYALRRDHRNTQSDDLSACRKIVLEWACGDYVRS